MKSPRLVSTLEKFLNAPSTGGFIEVLSEYGTRQFCCDEAVREQLNSVAMQRFEFTHSSFFKFDAELWKVLPTLPLHLNWGLISERRKNRLPQTSLNAPSDRPRVTSLDTVKSDQLKTLAGQVADLLDTKRDNEQSAINSTGQKLVFFAQVNAQLGSDPQFSSLISRSRELEDLLVHLCTAPEKNASYSNTYGSDADWSWISVCIAQCYLSALESFTPSAEMSDEVGDQLTAHLVAMTHLALIYTTALTAVGNLSSSVFASVGKFDTGLVDYPAYKIFPFAISEQTDDFLNDIPPFKRLGAFLMVSAAGFTANPAAFEYFVRCWIKNKWDLDDSHVESRREEIFCIVNASVAYLIFGKKPIEERVRYLIGKEATDEQVSAVKKGLRVHGFGEFPSVHYATFLNREVRDFRSDGVDAACGYFAEWLVKQANRHLKKHKTPLRLSFVSDIREASDDTEHSRFIRKRSTYYRSLSTLAINLAECEYEFDHFDKKPGFLCYIDATRAIAEGGYREYSAVFLCYALIRAIVFLHDEIGDIQVKALDDCVTDVIGDRWASEYLPVVLPHLVSNPNTPLEFRLWCESFLRKYQRPIAQVRQFKGFNNPISEAPPAVHIPEWFYGGTDVTADALQKVRTALKEESPSAPQWAQLMERNVVQDAVGELLRQLEAQLVMFFQEAYDAFYRSKQFRTVYEATTPEASLKPSGKSPSWGWIENFLGNIAIARDVGETAKNLKNLRALANAAQPGLGEVLISINGRTDIINWLAEARVIDNEFTSHNLPIKPYDRTVNSRGVVCKKRLTRAQVHWVYNYVTVDFGLLFEILHPMLSDSGSNDAN